mgnify:CR=1 FL=1
MSWVIFFIFMGGINIHVAFNYSIDTWVNFKLFGSTGLMLVFVVMQAIILAKHMKDPDDAKIVVYPENDYPLESATVQERISQRKDNDI